MSDNDIKSALEIAQEKIAKIGEPTAEERLTWKYVPEGEKLAGLYMKEDANMVAELAKYPENAREYVNRGASTVLIRNIIIPKTEAAKKTNKKAMDGLKLIKKDKVGVENSFSRLRYLFNHYAEQGEQQRKQAFAALKADFEEKFAQAAQQQLGAMRNVKIDVEKQPEFQAEWRKILLQFEAQYGKLLEEYKKELENIP